MLVIDRVLTNNSISTLYVITGALALMIICEMILGYIRRLFAEAAMTRIDGRLNLLVGERLFKLPLEYFETNPTGAITSKLGQMWRIRSFLVNELFGVTIEAIPMLLILPIMIMLSWELTLWVLAMATAVFVIVIVFIEPLGRLVQKVVAAEHRKGAHLSESIYGIKTVKSLALEGRRRYEWDALVAEGETTKYNLGVLANYPQTMALPFERLIYSGSFLLGAYTIVSTQLGIASGVSPQTLSPGSPGNVSANVVNIISPGSLIAFAMLSMRLAGPLIQLAHLIQEFVEVRGAIGQVGQVLNASKEKGHFGSGLRLPIEGEITFDNVRFRYSPTAAFALDGVSFKVPRGSMIGIMGRSGSGKTTVTRLLQGLNPDYEGIIKVDGMDLREIDLKHLRTNIGVVPQENFLFSGTIRENISIACPSATFAEVVRAAQMAGAEEFIERLPQGYETRLEEGASNLSGGQRQRLAIARALLVNPSVLILDEATSALDAESEAIINSNLARIALGRSIICISHRLSMLVPADQIIVLERGHVYDIGTHDELLQRCDIYSHLWHTQNRHVNRPPHVKLASNRPPEA
jgi:ATP-binding cassette subfamily B protein